MYNNRFSLDFHFETARIYVNSDIKKTQRFDGTAFFVFHEP